MQLRQFLALPAAALILRNNQPHKKSMHSVTELRAKRVSPLKLNYQRLLFASQSYAMYRGVFIFLFLNLFFFDDDQSQCCQHMSQCATITNIFSICFFVKVLCAVVVLLLLLLLLLLLCGKKNEMMVTIIIKRQPNDNAPTLAWHVWQN